MIEIMPLSGENWPLLRQVRLAALAEAPHAFASTYEREDAFDTATWRERAAGPGRFVAIDGDQPVGMATGLTLPELASDERLLVGMWVAPQCAVGASVTGSLPPWRIGLAEMARSDCRYGWWSTTRPLARPICAAASCQPVSCSGYDLRSLIGWKSEWCSI